MESDPEIETLLLAVPEFLEDFDEYLDALELGNLWLEQQGWTGQFQLASFHPQYQFEGTEADDAENLTNRAPVPIFQILREASLEAAISAWSAAQSVDSEQDATEQIFEANIERMQNLTPEQRQRLFGY